MGLKDSLLQVNHGVSDSVVSRLLENPDTLGSPVDDLAKFIKDQAVTVYTGERQLFLGLSTVLTNRFQEEQIRQAYTLSTTGVISNMTVSQTDVALSAFLLAMAMYPDVQKKAQAELDSVLEGMRLPEYSDKPRLPYVEAIMKETERWHPVAPMGEDLSQLLISMSFDRQTIDF